jgi:hypothetical protein
MMLLIKLNEFQNRFYTGFYFWSTYSDGGNWLFDTSVGDLRVYEEDQSQDMVLQVLSIWVLLFQIWWNEITGYLQNLKFQKNRFWFNLTDKPALILTATYLPTVSDRIKRQIMVYTIYDVDTNRDGKLDTNDIKSLYLSDINGKISLKYQQIFRN